MGYEHTVSFLVNSIIFGSGYQSTPVSSQSSLYTLGNLSLPLADTSAPLATVPLTDRSQPGYGIDPNLRTPYYENWNLSITRVLPKDLVIDARYVANVGKKLIRSPNINEAKVLWSRVKGLSYRDVAQSLDVSVKAVESLLIRAKRTLRENLDEYFNNPGR